MADDKTAPNTRQTHLTAHRSINTKQRLRHIIPFKSKPHSWLEKINNK